MVSVYRGKGYLVPLSFALAAIAVVACKGQPISLRTYHAILLVAVLFGGAFVAWYGVRSLRNMAEKLGRPLKAHEWVLDIAVWKPMPFDSFLYVQMPWWTLAHAAACYALLRAF
jgi:hypothetical protein